MTQITFNIHDEIILRLRSLEEQLPQILELGLKELNATSQVGFKGAADILELLASLPLPEEIIALRPSETLQTQINTLLEKNRLGQLSA